MGQHFSFLNVFLSLCPRLASCSYQAPVSTPCGVLLVLLQRYGRVFTLRMFPGTGACCSGSSKLPANDIGSPPLVTSCMLDMILPESVETCLRWMTRREDETQVIPIGLRQNHVGNWKYSLKNTLYCIYRLSLLPVSRDG